MQNEIDKLMRIADAAVDAAYASATDHKQDAGPILDRLRAAIATELLLFIA